MRAAQLVDLLGFLSSAEFEQLRLQHVERARAVLQLAALVLASDDDAGRQVGEAYGGVGRVDALPAGTARPVDVDANLVLGYLDVVGLLDDRCDVDVGE